jgi:DNA helicase-2/ATP-dependent DNA helicase PcrA
MLTPQDLEEERRLFYVALTRAKESVSLSFAQTRMRNGKHESNSPSRFLRELAPQYLDKPLRKEDFESRASLDDEDFGGGGFRWSGQRFPVKPGMTGSVKPGMTRSVVPDPERASRPKTVSEIKAELAARPKPPVTADFVPDPMSSFRVGDQIEHNRFGAGKVLEISGQVPDLKAKIVFEKYGEKLLLLKFAKIRHK